MSIIDAIKDLFNFTFDNPKNELKRVDIGKIDEKLAKKFWKKQELMWKIIQSQWIILE